jgi:hypothetical protein
MNHKDILKRAWQILWEYKALWIFGFILAITTASGSSSNAANGANNSSSSTDQNEPAFGESWEEGWEDEWADAEQELERFFDAINVEELVAGAVTIAILIGCVILILIIAATIFRYMSETALIRMVNLYEETGEKLSIREGFRLGFSRIAVKVFLVDLIINVPLIALGILFFGLMIVPIFLLLAVSEILGIVMLIGVFFVGIFIGVIVFAVVSLFKHFFRRAVAIDGYGVFDAISNGFRLARQRLLDVGLMWLITTGISIGFSILLIPVAIIVLIIAAVVGGGIGLMVGGLTGLVTGSAVSIIVGIAAGLPTFILLMVVPLGFLDGLREIYISTTWTLTFREARALENLDLDLIEEGTI